MDTEQQVRLDFLSEAEEYFDSLESLLLDLDSQGADPSLLDTAMRSAHSLKGGAAMMRYASLSKIAHRLEDFLKILRVRKDNNLLDKEVTTLLLRGVDCMRAARDLHREQDTIDETWIVQNTHPVFDRLRDRLGELQEEDEDLLLAEEEQVDVSALIFQSGVEECLESFKAKIGGLTPTQLKAELAIQAEQLAEFGMMSQVTPFIQLCNSVQQQLENTPLEEVQDLAYQALKVWERSHALVLVGRMDKLPQSLDGSVAISSALHSDSETHLGDLLNASELEELQSLTASNSQSLDFLETDFTLDEFTPDVSELSELDTTFDDLESINFETPNAESIDLDQVVPDAAELMELDAAFADLEPVSAEAIDLDQVVPDATELMELDAAFADLESVSAEAIEEIPQTQIRVPDLPQVKQPNPIQNQMVKVPAVQLQRLNDLSTRLILERNASILRLQQLKDFVDLTRERMWRLEQSSNRLRQLYDWASQEGTLPSAQSIATINSTWESVSTLDASEKFDSLEMDRYTDLHLLSQEQMETIVQLQEVTTDIGFGVEEMGQVIRNLSLTTRELQQNVTRFQMRPFSELVGRFPRLIRDLSAQHDKQVELVIEGKTTQIDRQAMEYLSDPLTHLLRNAFDHGLEDATTRAEAGKVAVGKIVLKAFQKGNQTIIEIQDDGGGIDTHKIRERLLKMGLSADEVEQIPDEDVLDAIFEPGFSTAAQVTELSGRGVGMDVVRSNLQQIRGDIQVKTKLGQGTTFTIAVPLSLLVIRVVIVESADMVFAIPVSSIKEIIKFDSSKVTQVQAQEFFDWRNQSVGLIRPHQHLNYQRPSKKFEMSGSPKIKQPTVVIFSDGEKLQGIYLEKYWSEQEVAIRSINTAITLFPGFNGSTVLGDGRVIPLIEPSAFCKGIVKHQRLSLSKPDASKLDVPTGHGQAIVNSGFPNSVQSTIMVVDDSVNVRRYLAGVLERNGYRVEEAKDGQDAVDKLMAGLQVQAVVCDVEMPRLDGYGVLSEVKSDPRFEKLPIAMLTSRSNQKHRQLAMKLGASAYFSKPFNEQEMLETLSNLIAQ